MRNASWRDSKSFAKFYHKSVEDPGKVQRTILRSVRNEKTPGDTHEQCMIRIDKLAMWIKLLCR